MRRISFFLCALILFPASVNAASTASLGTVECTGSQTSTLTDAATFQCTGDFSFLDGYITSDSKIVISADGSLYFENLLINAPAVELVTLSGALSIGSGVIINTNDFLVIGAGANASPTVNVVSGAMITVGNGDAARTIGVDEISLSMGGGGSIHLVSEPITELNTIITVVPLPGALGLMLSGFVVLFGLNRRRCVSIGC